MLPNVDQHGLVGSAFGGIPLPDPALPWDDRLRVLLGGAHEVLTAHPVVVRALASDQANPRSLDALSFIDAVLGALLDAGLGERDAARRYRSLFGLVFGSILISPVPPGQSGADEISSSVG